MSIENTLFLGNGFSRSIFKDIPSWGSLFEEDEEDEENKKDKEDKKDKEITNLNNYTILYEKYFLDKNKDNKNIDESKFKKGLMKKINIHLSKENVNDNIKNLENFGKYLLEANINNIITTNYDEGIEYILTNFCSYKKENIDITTNEHVYSIRTYKEYVNIETNHKIKLWKIHGDISREILEISKPEQNKSKSTEYSPYKTITLGFDQYCGSLSKLNNYLKGKYESDKGVKCELSIQKKCKIAEKMRNAGKMQITKKTQIVKQAKYKKLKLFDGLSWAELFFRSNIYIVGFGMSFSEIDIWWLINKRARIYNEVKLSNKIYYLYNGQYDKNEDIHEILEIFKVDCEEIDSDKDYLDAIFSKIRK